jgi:hypothetical protein
VVENADVPGEGEGFEIGEKVEEEEGGAPGEGEGEDCHFLGPGLVRESARRCVLRRRCVVVIDLLPAFGTDSRESRPHPPRLSPGTFGSFGVLRDSRQGLQTSVSF